MPFKLRSRTYVTLVVAAVSVLFVTCRHGSDTDQDQPLLLLEEPDCGDTAGLPPATGPVADNSPCFVCHMNYQDERLAVTHARANVGCAECHGPSHEHCADEDNVTPPDIMFPRTAINAACLGCHPKSKVAELAAHRQLNEAQLDGVEVWAGNVCTDCHGEHRLEHRRTTWDKSTGELLPE